MEIDKDIENEWNPKAKLRPGSAPLLLRDWASSRGVSFRVLSTTLGIPQSSLSLYMHGHVLPSLENAAKIYKATHGMVDFTDWFNATDLAPYSEQQYEDRRVGRPPKGESSKVAKKRKKQRKEYTKMMTKKQKEKSTDRQRQLEAQARLLMPASGFTEV